MLRPFPTFFFFFCRLFLLADPSAADQELSADKAAAETAAETTVLEVSVTDRLGIPIEDLVLGDFEVLEDGESRALVSAELSSPARHILVFIDLPSSPPGDRHQTLPPLRSFLLERSRRGDPITLATLRPRAGKSELETLCKYSSDPVAVGQALDRLASHKGAGFRAGNPRKTSDRRELRDAFQAFEQALALAAGDGRSSLVLYLGRSLTSGIVEGTHSDTAVVQRPVLPDDQSASDGVDPTNYARSVQYLVSLPRSGPLQSTARGHGDRLLLAALDAQAAVFPLVASLDAPALGSELWLARETGGQPLSIRRLQMDLDRLSRQLDQVYELTFQSGAGPDSRVHPLRVKTSHEDRDLEVRHLRGYRAVDAEARLDARAQAAWRLGSRENPLELDARITTSSHGEPPVTALELIMPAPSLSGSLTLSLAVPTVEGLVTRRQPLPYRVAGESTLRMRIPLQLPEDFQGLGLAIRDDSSRQISVMTVGVPSASGK